MKWRSITAATIIVVIAKRGVSFSVTFAASSERFLRVRI